MKTREPIRTLQWYDEPTIDGKNAVILFNEKDLIVVEKDDTRVQDILTFPGNSGAVYNEFLQTLSKNELGDYFLCKAIEFSYVYEFDMEKIDTEFCKIKEYYKKWEVFDKKWEGNKENEI